MKNKELTKKILNAVHNSKRNDNFGKKEVVENLLVRKIQKIVKDDKEAKKQLKDTMQIIENFFFPKWRNSDVTIERESEKGWFYLSEETAKKLKKQLIKFQKNK